MINHHYYPCKHLKTTAKKNTNATGIHWPWLSISIGIIGGHQSLDATRLAFYRPPGFYMFLLHHGPQSFNAPSYTMSALLNSPTVTFFRLVKLGMETIWTRQLWAPFSPWLWTRGPINDQTGRAVGYSPTIFLPGVLMTQLAFRVFSNYELIISNQCYYVSPLSTMVS